MSTSAEEQHRQLFEEFCVRIYAAARSKTISQREAGSEFTERCDAGSGAQVRAYRIAGFFRGRKRANFAFLKFSPSKESYIYIMTFERSIFKKIASFILFVLSR